MVSLHSTEQPPRRDSTSSSDLMLSLRKARGMFWETREENRRNGWITPTSLFFQIYQLVNYSASMSGIAMGVGRQQKDRKVLGDSFSTKTGGQLGVTFTYTHAHVHTLRRQ